MSFRIGLAIAGFALSNDNEQALMNSRHVTLDAYVIDTLMRDLVGHDRNTAAFLVFLHFWRQTNSATQSLPASYESIATDVGLSKRTVQNGVSLLLRRGLISVKRAYATAVPEYRVRKPWVRKRSSPQPARAAPGPARKALR